MTPYELTEVDKQIATVFAKTLAKSEATLAKAMIAMVLAMAQQPSIDIDKLIIDLEKMAMLADFGQDGGNEIFQTLIEILKNHGFQLSKVNLQEDQANT